MRLRRLWKNWLSIKKTVTKEHIHTLFCHRFLFLFRHQNVKKEGLCKYLLTVCFETLCTGSFFISKPLYYKDFLHFWYMKYFHIFFHKKGAFFKNLFSYFFSYFLDFYLEKVKVVSPFLVAENRVTWHDIFEKERWLIATIFVFSKVWKSPILAFYYRDFKISQKNVNHNSSEKILSSPFYIKKWKGRLRWSFIICKPCFWKFVIYSPIIFGFLWFLKLTRSDFCDTTCKFAHSRRSESRR